MWSFCQNAQGQGAFFFSSSASLFLCLALHLSQLFTRRLTWGHYLSGSTEDSEKLPLS